jgi:hypothetical protein
MVPFLIEQILFELHGPLFQELHVHSVEHEIVENTSHQSLLQMTF